MKKAQLVDTNLKSEDKRRNLVGLSEKGYAIAERMKTTLSDVNLAIEELKQEANINPLGNDHQGMGVFIGT